MDSLGERNLATMSRSSCRLFDFPRSDENFSLKRNMCASDLAKVLTIFAYLTYQTIMVELNLSIRYSIAFRSFAWIVMIFSNHLVYIIIMKE